MSCEYRIFAILGSPKFFMKIIRNFPPMISKYSVLNELEIILTGKWYLLAGIYILVMPSQLINMLLPIKVDDMTVSAKRVSRISNVVVQFLSTMLAGKSLYIIRGLCALLTLSLANVTSNEWLLMRESESRDTILIMESSCRKNFETSLS
jgi:hypothetical protein